MGTTASTLLQPLRTTYLSLLALAAELSTTNSAFAALLARVSASPGLPVAHPTAPFWLQDPPFPGLCDAQSAAGGLPERARVVVVGSGVAGAAACWALLRGEGMAQVAGTAAVEEQQYREVVMLEARSVCSGATGRNGGHVKVSPWEVARALKLRGVGGERARKIVGFQRRHLRVLGELCRAEGWEAAEMREVETVDLFVDKEEWEQTKECMAELEREEWMKDLDWGVEVWEGEDAREKFHTSDYVVGALSYRAGALWPYRLVTSILSSLLRDFPASFSIETHTAVERISTRNDSGAPFCVHTSRGDVIASHVIHATNGHCAALIPGLVGKLFPVRGQMTAQRPGKLFPQIGGIRSWSIIHHKSGFEYMTQRPGSPNGVNGKGGELMLGGALLQSGSRGLDEIGIASDADVNFNVGTYLSGILPMLFGAKHWGSDAEAGRLQSMWTGIMGFTVDMMPFVGRLDPRITGREIPKRSSSDGIRTQEGVMPAEWIAAGYNGEGMVNAWLCGVAVGLMVLGRDGADLKAELGIPGGKVTDWLPGEYLISRERLAKGSIYELAAMI